MIQLYITKNKSTKELLDYVLNELEIKNEVLRSKYGKPYIENNEIYFNLSDSGLIVGCAVSDQEVGLDIQKKVFSSKVIKKYFNKEEKKLATDAENFTKIWAKKESYVKYTGIGLSYGLQKVDTTKKDFYISEYEECIISIYPYDSVSIKKV